MFSTLKAASSYLGRSVKKELNEYTEYASYFIPDAVKRSFEKKTNDLKRIYNSSFKKNEELAKSIKETR